MFCRYYFKYSNDNGPAYTNEACTPISSGYQIRKSEMMAVENSFFLPSTTWNSAESSLRK